jgi:hypothetical protein
MDIGDEEPRLLFGGELLVPNPLAFLSKADLWQSDTSQAIMVPLGHVHGDLHSDNIICQRQSTERPDVVDFATYEPNQLIFFDFTYLEFDILTRICPPVMAENRRQLLHLLEFLACKGDFTLQNAPPGGPVVRTLTQLIQPLRQAAQDMFGQRPDDFETAFWVSATATGLNFARKRTRSVNRYLNLLGLMYAAVALRRVLDDLRISYSSEQVPSIAWVKERDWDAVD